MLNFMAEHVNRHAGYDSVQASFGRFLASSEWRQDFDRLPNGLNNEQKVLNLLRRKIKSVGAASFAPHFQILKPGQERVKMRLLLGTNSGYGVEVFRNVQSKIEREETELRRQMDEEKFGVNLFPIDEIAQDKQGISGIGSAKFQDEAKNQIIEILSKHNSVNFSNLAVSIMEEIPMRKTHINKLLKDMKSEEIIEYKLPPRKKVPQSDTIIHFLKK